MRSFSTVSTFGRIAAHAQTTITNVGLGLVFVATLALEVTGLHPAWPVNVAVGGIVWGVALFRAFGRVWAAAIGLAVCAVAAVLGLLFALPTQPGVSASVALPVLGAAAVRVAKPWKAAVIAVTGVAVLLLDRYSLLTVGHSRLLVLASVLLWLGALAVGLLRRFLDARGHRQVADTSITSITRQIPAHTETIANSAMGAVLAVLVALQAAIEISHVPRAGVFGLVFGVVMSVITLLRGRQPVWAAAAGLTVAAAASAADMRYHLLVQADVAAIFALMVLGAAAVRVARPWQAVVIAPAGVAVLVPMIGHFSTYLLFLVVLIWIGMLAVGVWLRFLDARRRLELDAVRRHERLELARDLHDVVAHHVAGIVVQAQAAQLVAAKNSAPLDGTLAEIESAGNDALAAMRRVVSLLRDGDDPGGARHGSGQLRELVDRFAGRGPAVRLRLPDADQPPWPPEVATTVYRVVQEALTNVVLHAPGATNVTVNVDTGPSGVTVEVSNDAPAGSAGASWFNPSGGNGLVGMRERVEALGGTLRAEPGPDGGWEVRAELPLPARSTT